MMANEHWSGIVGGKAVKSKSTEAASVVMIYGESIEGKPFICTGSFISDSVVITAAHCVVDDITKLTLAYGVNPFMDAEVRTLSVRTIVRHEAYKSGAAVASERNDLALIKFSGGLPVGAKTVGLPVLDFKQSKFQNLMALGYGRTEGREDTEKPESEVGLLRSVRIADQSFDIRHKAFVISQKNNKGVCSGDSGGPLLETKIFESSQKLTLVGIASGVSDAVGEDKSDVCQQNSVFMNVQAYLPWIHKNLY